MSTQAGHDNPLYGLWFFLGGKQGAMVGIGQRSNIIWHVFKGSCVLNRLQGGLYWIHKVSMIQVRRNGLDSCCGIRSGEQWLVLDSP